MNTIITIKNKVKAPVEKVWKYWTEPKHIIKWNQASEDWHTPKAENDLRIGGKFVYRMESKNGSVGFDFEGVYTSILVNNYIEYIIADGRKVNINFIGGEDETEIVESFVAETTHSIEQQHSGWQAILDSFKKHVETDQ
jgi:uncharacterized protein YndB with AHSA1/START domain